MGVDAIASSGASAVSSAASKYVKQVTSGSDTSSPMEEATETAAATAKEAQQGDPVAKRLVAKVAQEKALQQQETAPAQEPGKGTQIDQQA